MADSQKRAFSGEPMCPKISVFFFRENVQVPQRLPWPPRARRQRGRCCLLELEEFVFLRNEFFPYLKQKLGGGFKYIFFF